MQRILWFKNYCDYFICETGEKWFNLESFLADLGFRPRQFVLKIINLHEQSARTEEKENEIIKSINTLIDSFSLQKFNNAWIINID